MSTTTPYDLLNSVSEDDVNVAPPEEYPDNSANLIPEGTYDFRILKVIADFDDAGTFKKSVNLAELEVVAVPDDTFKGLIGRKVRNLRVWTTTFLRNGAKVSGLGDLVRGVTLDSWSGMPGAMRVLEEARDAGSIVQIRTVWSAYDKEGAEQSGVKRVEKGSQEEKEIRKRCSLKGMKNFRQMPDGSYYPEAIGPVSGAPIEGRMEIASVVPVNKRRTLIS